MSSNRTNSPPIPELGYSQSAISGEGFTLCRDCGTPIGGDENAHQAHDIDECRRFLDGYCGCDGWSCSRCCPECVVTPLAAALLVAREDTRARAEAEMVSTERAEQVAG